jgi:4,5:9,10-diseco-3-hydroxy-5,9,17-trioxoandrosta-1(10),2-diene-4-oate hydrolase
MINGNRTPTTATEERVQTLNIRANGHRLHCLRAGSGPSVVLLHGGASDSRDWVETMTAFSHSHTLHAPDILGYGKSDRTRTAYYLREFVESTLEFIRELDFDSHVLVGHSIGGRVCLEIALRHPELVHKLVLIDTAGFGKLARWGMYMGAAMYWLRRMLHVEQPYPRFLKEDGEDRDWRCLGRLPELRVPTLIIWNRRDPYYPVSHAFAASQLVPDVRLEVFPGYGHAPHLQRRDRFNELLLDFLSSG